ncbi:MAG: CHAD domain-containing protein [Candidatus Omnitrophica bacterium]|nr:CHAD domain-containing protein [Candidatus Omnitrophota bacterium]
MKPGGSAQEIGAAWWDGLRRALSALGTGPDAAAVHQARVYARRMRVVLSAGRAEIGRGPARRAARALARLAKALGPVRDWEVRTVFLERCRKSAPAGAIRKGISLLLRSARRQQTEAQRGLRRAVRDFVRRDAVAALSRAAGVPADGRRVRKKIRKQLLSLQRYSKLPSAGPRQHALRLKIRKLRYRLEFLAAWPDGFRSSFVSAVKKIQDLLGAAHDADIQQRWVAKEGILLPEPLRRGVVPYVREQCRREKKAACAELRKYWRRFAQDMPWEYSAKAP